MVASRSPDDSAASAEGYTFSSMPLQTWDVVVHGRAHRAELDRNAESGKYVLRIDGRVALKPFSEERGQFPLEISGRPFLLHVAPSEYALEDKGSRYVDASAPRASANLGRVTISRGLEHITVVTDPALLRIEGLSEGFKRAMIASSGGGLLGAIVGSVGLEVGEKLMNRLGETTRDQPIRSFDDLKGDTICRLEHLPLDLVSLFSDQVGLEARVLVVPRRSVTGIDLGRAKMLVRTTGTAAPGAKPHKFDLVSQLQEAIDHLHAAGYPLDPESRARVSAEALAEKAAPPSAPANPRPAPAQPSATVVRAGSLPQVRRTAPLVTAIGSDPELLHALEVDAEAYRLSYPKTVIRKTKFDETLRLFERERFDVVHLVGGFDEKTRFRVAAGSTISLKDLIALVAERGTRLVWLASENDPVAAEQTLRWAAGLNLLVVFTLARGEAYGEVLREALQRLAAGEALSAVLPEIETRSSSRFKLVGRGEAVFLPQ